MVVLEKSSPFFSNIPATTLVQPLLITLAALLLTPLLSQAAETKATTLSFANGTSLTFESIERDGGKLKCKNSVVTMEYNADTLTPAERAKYFPETQPVSGTAVQAAPMAASNVTTPNAFSSSTPSPKVSPASHAAETDKTASKPNIIVIYTDDQGYSDLGSMGIMKDVKTPNLDAFAAGGARMTDGYVTAPQCSPSRCGLISGQYQGHFGMDCNGDLEKFPDLLERFRALNNLPKRMQKAGYMTGMAGKSHLGSDDSAELVKLGFDKVFFKHGNGPGSWNMDLTGHDIPPQQQKGNGYHLEMITDFACAFINRFHKQPFFFYLAYRGPHVPLDAPHKYLERFPGPMPEERRKALGSISCIDEGVGRIMETLRKNGLEENTLLFVISDNGAPLGNLPHHFVTDDNNSRLKTLVLDTTNTGKSWDGSLNDPMNGEKGMLTEGGIRVPWLVHWKGTIPGGQVYTNPVISLDVAATANAMAGLPPDPMLDGVNLIPQLSGKSPTPPHDTLFWRWVGQYAVRQGDWKYIFLVGNNRQYLFNLATDPEEQHNLLTQQPELAKSLHAKLEHWSQGLMPAGLVGPNNPGKNAMMMGCLKKFDFYIKGKTDDQSQPKHDSNSTNITIGH